MHQKTYKNMAVPILQTGKESGPLLPPAETLGLGLGSNSHKKIEDAFPKLIHELDDAHSHVPAYMRFQD